MAGLSIPKCKTFRFGRFCLPGIFRPLAEALNKGPGGKIHASGNVPFPQYRVSLECCRMESQPIFSILIASYNYGHFIDQALDSALSQRFPVEKVELLVVDDGSTDGTAARLAFYGSKIRAIYQPNQGEVAAYLHRHPGGQGTFHCLSGCRRLLLSPQALRRDG